MLFFFNYQFCCCCYDLKTADHFCTSASIVGRKCLQIKVQSISKTFLFLLKKDENLKDFKKVETEVIFTL